MPKKRSEKMSRKNAGALGAQYLQNCLCFTCDEPVKNNGVQIVLGRTPYSNVGLPAKIGQLIGDGFMLVVGVSDTICARCASLLSHLDKLETDARTVKKTLMGYIAAKYQLNHKEICAKIDQSELASETYQILDHSSANNSLVKPRHQVYGKKPSQVSLLVSNQSKNNAKNFNCSNCIFSTTNANAFQTHSSLCLKPVSRCTQCDAQLPEPSCENYQLIGTHTFSGTCSGCSSCFDSENELTRHMAIHIIDYEKCGICGFASSDKENVSEHVSTHGNCVFRCSLCPALFNVRTALAVHIGYHTKQRECLQCSYELASDPNILPGCIITQNENGNNENEAAQAESKTGDRNDIITGKNVTERLDDCGSSIEFHPCPNCGLTFLNKMLFSEHMKMHDKRQNEDPMDVSDAHEDVLKSAAVSVAGDCSIDDDLEDLFEKLHAETTNASNSDQSDILKAICSKEDERTDLQCSLNSLEANLEAPSTEKSSSFCEVLNTALSNEVSQISTKLISQTEETFIENNEALMVQSHPDSKISSIFSLNRTNNDSNSAAIHSIHPDGTGNDISSPQLSTVTIQQDFTNNGTVLGEFVNQDSSQESINSIFGSSQQAFIYISNSEGTLPDCDSEGMVLHNATIDPESGQIHLIPFVLNDALSSSQMQSPLMEGESSNSSETQIFEQNFCEMKPEPGLAQSKPDADYAADKDVLSCEYCSFQTSIELVMKRHQKIHQGNVVHKCSICNRVFSSTQRLLSHLNLHHKSVGPVECSICVEAFDDLVHLRQHLSEKHPVEKNYFSCRFCGEKFSTKRSCSSHEESHSEIFKFQCKICVKKYMSEDDLDDHVKWEHDKAGQCRFCGKLIEKPKTLRNHELRHMQESNHHECQVCKRVFKTKTGLRHHTASHTGQFKFCCDFCGRGFMSRMMLEEHRSCHTKEERYICDVCGQKFSFQSTYWIHRKWHETPYPYKCNFCGRFFRHSSLLAVHKRKHTGERPYKCPHCPLSFPVGGTLKRHIILHTGVYPFNCDVCKRGFTARHKYASHLAKVHGIKDSFHQKISPNDSMVIVPEEVSNNVQTKLKKYKCNDIAINQTDSTPVLDSYQAPSVSNGHIFMADQNLQSRVVEIVMDDSYQAVATVTLADVAENEPTLHGIW